MINRHVPSISEVLKGQLYIGNLPAAISVDLRKKHGITHVLSMCPDLPSSGTNHMVIPVQDSEFEDLLIHLPQACSFISLALGMGGRMLVHCVMGISRSTAVIAAFLMKTTRMTGSDALFYLKQRRPQVHPNYGFIRQLDVFAKCNFDPSTSNPIYRSWKRSHRQEITAYLNYIEDTVSIIPEKLLLSSELPSDPVQAKCYLSDLEITHFISLSPAQIPLEAISTTVKHRSFNIHPHAPEALLFALNDICASIDGALRNGGLVLVHSASEARVCMAACAYLMISRRNTPDQAIGVIEAALPLFHRAPAFSGLLELFLDCNYSPTPGHRLVKEWLSSSPSNQNPSSTSELHKTAASILSETGFDMGAFGDALSSIQQNSAISVH